MAKYLDENGLLYFWNKIKAALGNKVDKVSGKGLSTNDYTTAEKTKLSGIETNANKYVHPTHTAKTSGLYKVTVDGSGHVSGTAAVAKSDITGLGIPGQDTTYSDMEGATLTADGANGLVPKPVKGDDGRFLSGDGTWKDALIDIAYNSDATEGTISSMYGDGSVGTSTIIGATTSRSGLLSASDKTKLNGIAANANNYVHPTSDGNKHVPATGTTNNGKFLMAGSTAGSLSWGTPADTKYNDFTGATASAAGTHGLVPAPAAGSQSTKYLRADGTWQTPPDTKYTHPTTAGNKHIPSGGSESQILAGTSTSGTAQWVTPAFNLDKPRSEINRLTMLGSEIIFKTGEGLSGSLDKTVVTDDTLLISMEEATQSQKGAMSSTDKKKLDGIAANANNYVHPTSDGNKHVPATGTTNNGKFLMAGATAGSLAWGTPADTKYNDFTGATFSKDGTNGLVPKPTTSDGGAGKVLGGNGTWMSIIGDLYFLTNQGDVELTFLDGFNNRIVAAIPNVSENNPGIMGAQDKKKLNELPTVATIETTYAKKSDITGMYKYKGSVADSSKLPTTGRVTGDVYNIETASVYGGAGMNVAWNGTEWDPLGEIFTITSLSNSEIDTICA